jgi:erythromycin esterase
VVTVVRDIAFDADDTDLLPLARAIGPARIVVLGEATHSDGATSRAKARIARFLHRRMGFDVLAWESGFLQSHGMNVALRDTARSLEHATSFLMAGGWAWDRDIQPLFQYARDSWRTERPFFMAGFDTGRPHRAAPYFMQLVGRMFAENRGSALAPADRVTVTELAERAFGFLSSAETPGEVRESQLAALARLEGAVEATEDSLRVHHSPREIAFLRRSIEHLRVSEYLKEARGAERAFVRDREMARTVRWLVDEMYAGRKIVIWAATAHFIRNSDLISNPADSTMYTIPYEAGNHLAAWFGRDLYTIAFTSYAGELGEVSSSGQSQTRPATPARQGTLEARLHALGHPFAFLDASTAVTRGALPQHFPSIALGRIENTAPWANVVDAFFFLDSSEPVRHIR